MKRYDLIIIGTGAAGLTAAFTALGFGKRVLVVEKDRPGGECTWSGCVPSKALINQAKAIHTAKQFADIAVDGAAVLEKVRAVSERVYLDETPDVLEKAGAEYLNGVARFVDAHHIEVDGERYYGRKFILATGSRPLLPPIDGLDDVDYLTNESVFQQRDLPKSLLVLGGGVISMELAQAMNRLGVAATIVEMAPEVLPREEPEFAAALRARLQAEGVRFEVGAQAVQVKRSDAGVTLVAQRDGQTFELSAERLLVALGRRANVENLGLDTAGVKVDRGLVLNKQLRTTAKNIYACGDVAGPYLLSHMANYQGKIAAMNAILPLRRSVNYDHVSWAIFTDPEFARAGLTEAEAREQYGDGIRVYHYDMAEKLDRAKTKAGDGGRIKLITSSRGKVLGAHILAERAGELIAEVQVLKALGLNFAKLQGVIHPYPTYADSLRQMSQQVLLDNIFQHPVVRFARKLIGK
ncbi:dihydrolipoyl dehydrogenase family protein [Saccharospirillum mangrovi]|uniref:dihydrolipoyl dehydrogenase family protein n=1 Tax=Saccharospirillum mangrovi TaxID=2161747 RepID=UPI000D3DBAAE|nr:NAD(P)/FAD-dependent oxidoreductase [Saccharospirillum mangrovi]